MRISVSKFADNQFDVATNRRIPLMSEVLDTTLPRITVAADSHPALIPARDAIIATAAAWNAGETRVANSRAAQMGATVALADKLASLTRTPSAEVPSIIETWAITIRSQVAYRGSTYKVLLPNGRKTLTPGKLEPQLDALRDFAIRLGEQTDKPALVALGAVVTAWSNEARALRKDQLDKIALADQAEDAMKPLRKAAAAELYAMVGLGMIVFKDNPSQVDSLFEVNLLRRRVLPVPDAPVDIFWDPALRLLSASALPAKPTRLEAWRRGPGGVAEQIAIGVRGEKSVLIPESIVFAEGEDYELWLQGKNGSGSSTAGPVITWTSPL